MTMGVSRCFGACLTFALAAGIGTPSPAALSLALPGICEGAAQDSFRPETDGAVQSVALLIEEDALSGVFGARLLGAMHAANPGNAIVSPLGVGAVLAMVAPGAQRPVRSAIGAVLGAGNESADAATAAVDPGLEAIPQPAGLLACQLAALGNAELVDERIDLQFANGAFGDPRLDVYPAFATVLRDSFGARVERLDFSDPGSVDRINAWVSEATAGAIPQVISELEPDDVLVLANALRFRGDWSQSFDPEKTAPAAFHPNPDATVEVPTMHAEEMSARYREGDGFQAMALPYGEGSFEFVVVLPATGTEPGVVLERLASEPAWLGGEGFRSARGSLSIPKLSLELEASLLPALRSLGLASAIDDPQAFAGIASPAPVLSRVLHRAMLEIDEQGTEAAAATAAVMTTRSAEIEEETFVMRVDRPFALAVRYRPTGAVLFLAWVADPASR